MTGHRSHVEALCLRATQRDRGSMDPKLEGVTADRAAQESHLGPFDETEYHQALHRRVRHIDGFDADAIARL
jgi:hypothetical protein